MWPMEILQRVKKKVWEISPTNEGTLILNYSEGKLV
jgi:hypothetical protein